MDLLTTESAQTGEDPSENRNLLTSRQIMPPAKSHAKQYKSADGRENSLVVMEDAIRIGLLAERMSYEVKPDHYMGSP